MQKNTVISKLLNLEIQTYAHFKDLEKNISLVIQKVFLVHLL